MKAVHAGLILPLLAAACGQSPGTTDRAGAGDAVAARPTGSATPPIAAVASAAPTATPVSGPVATDAPPGILSCRADIGAAAAARRVAVCRNVSPATHPPCNAANSCAMIEDEIARSCALFDGQGEPMAGCSPAPKSMAAAAAVVQRYYSAINARDYDTAWQQWGEDGQPGRTRAAFERGFADTRAVRVAIGRLEPGDGAAGSIYQPVPVTVTSTMVDGSHRRFAGSYVVRRVNGVDGASPAQLRWHLDSARLRPVAAP